MPEQLSNQAYEPLRRGVSIRAIVLTPEYDAVFLVKNEYTEQWSIPGGHQRNHESVDDTLQRELFEETGVHAPIAARYLLCTVMAVFQPDNDSVYQVTNCYYRVDDSVGELYKTSASGLFVPVEEAIEVVRHRHEVFALQTLLDTPPITD